MKIIQNIKNWYNNLPEKASQSFQLDKQILKSTKENLMVSASLVLVGILTSFLDQGFGTLAIIIGVTAFSKDVVRTAIKFIKDYSHLS